MKYITLALLLTLVSESYAIVVDFEPPPLGPRGGRMESYYEEDNVVLTGRFAHYGTSVAGSASNSSQGIMKLLYGGSMHITMSDSSRFDFISIDLAEYSEHFIYPKTVSFTGYFSDGRQVSHSFRTDGIFDSIGGVNDFETFYFPDSFRGLDSVWVDSVPFAMDNLQIEAVAEPPVNKPPIADAGEDQLVSADHNRSAWGLLDGTGSTDPDGDPLTYYWEWNDGSATGATLLVNFPLGTNNVTLYVSDGIDESSDTVTIIVADTSPPSMSISVAPSFLWPPTHKMEPVELTVFARDSCDPNPNVVLNSITMNEGDHDDYEIVDLHHVMLRSERDGNQQDRIYTLHYSATDFSGNSTFLDIDITVPHDRRDKTN